MSTPRKLETHLAWMADDVRDPAAWTVVLDAADQVDWGRNRSVSRMHAQPVA